MSFYQFLFWPFLFVLTLEYSICKSKLNRLQYSCIMLYSVLLYFSAKIPANAENCIRQMDFSAETRWFYLTPKHLCRFYHQFCFQIDVPRMLIVSWNVTYKPAPSNTNFQCVSQLNATSGCGSGLRGLREETVLKCVEMHSILNYNKKYWYIEHIRSVRIPRGGLV